MIYWIPILLITISINSWLSCNLHRGSHYSVIMYLMGLVPTWTIVASYSKDILKDAIIYDLILVIMYPLLIGYFSNSFFEISYTKMTGFAITIFGIVIFVVNK